MHHTCHPHCTCYHHCTCHGYYFWRPYTPPVVVVPAPVLVPVRPPHQFGARDRDRHAIKALAGR